MGVVEGAGKDQVSDSSARTEHYLSIDRLSLRETDIDVKKKTMYTV